MWQVAVAFLLFTGIFWWVSNRNIGKTYKHDGIKVIIANDAKSCINALKEILSLDPKPQYVGYDCEWASNIISGRNQKKISLIQIGHKDLIILIRIHLFHSSIPIELVSFLGDINIIKCGVGIYGDVKKLKKDYNIDMHGVVDINDIMKQDLEKSSKYLGLKNISNNFLNKEMIYKNSINHTEWENNVLNDIQIHYAADDAIVAFNAFKKIIKTQYNTNNIMEICFGKIDTNLNGSKSRIGRNKFKSKSCIKLNKKNKHTDHNIKGNKVNKRVTLLDYNGEYLTLIQIGVAKTLLKRGGVKKVNSQTVQMLYNDIKPIDVHNNDMDHYIRIVCIPDEQCMVCGTLESDLCCKHKLKSFQSMYIDKGQYRCDECNKANDIHSEFWGCRICNYDRCGECFITKQNRPKKTGHLTDTLLIYRTYSIFTKIQKDPYNILLCGDCNAKSNRIRGEYQNELYKLITSNNQQFNKMNSLYKTRNICYNLKHKKKRHSLTVDEQNQYVAEILKYCNYSDDDIDTIKIKECDFNLEINMDWWYNNNDYNYIVIKFCIQQICLKRRKKRKEHNIHSTDVIWNVFKNRQIEFSEMWRKNFMKQMNPKYYNKKYQTIEIYLPENRRTDNQNILSKKCKHKILDCNGNILTRTSRRCTDTVGLINDRIAQQRYNMDNAAKRTNNTKIQLLYPKQKINIDDDYKYDGLIRTIVWIPFKETNCYICGEMNDLKIYNVFPMYYYDKLFEDDDEKHTNLKYNMQFYVPLCVKCESKAIRFEKEFECYLFLKHINDNGVINDMELCAFKLAQKCERYKLSIDEQNEYCYKILNYFNVDDLIKEEMKINECHCNKEIDIDWYYLNDYKYVIIKECIEKLISSNSVEYQHQLCQIFKRKKLQFISIWVDNFLLKTNNKDIGFEITHKTV